jgi:hypothetical protein
VALLELFSALLEGDLELKKGALAAIQKYRALFLPNSCYDSPNLEILYCAFRHKIAHLSHPHAVFDSHTANALKRFPRLHMTWTIASRKRGAPPLRLEQHPSRQLVKNACALAGIL